MLFLGTTFFSGSHTLDPPAVHVSPVTEIKLTNGTFEHLYVSKNSEETIESTHNEWNGDTLLSAPFDDSLDAGNSGFSLKNTDVMIVKCREKGSMDWITIHTKDINTIEDFKMLYFYRYAGGILIIRKEIRNQSGSLNMIMKDESAIPVAVVL